MPPSALSFVRAAEICLPAIQEAQETMSQAPAPANQTCFKGCGACCHSALISTSSIEAFGLLVAWIGIGRSLEELATRCQRYVASYLEFRDRLGYLPFSLESRRLFMKERLPCPLFLRGQERFAGSCGVFEHRPVICTSYHSLSQASGCETLDPHEVHGPYISLGEDLATGLRAFERQLFGKSALGHLPMLLASLTTQEGLAAFLRVEEPGVYDEESQQELDFSFLVTLYQAAGIAMTSADIDDLIKAQSEIES